MVVTKKILFFSCSLLLLTAGWVALQKTVLQTKHARKYYNDFLHDQELSIWKKLNAVGVTAHECRQIQNDHLCKQKNITTKKQKQKEFPKKLSTKMRRLVTAVLSDFNISPKAITLQPYKHRSPAATENSCLFIDEETMNTFSPKAQRFIIAHELQHFCHYDSAMEYAMQTILTKKAVKQTHLPDDPYNPLNEYSRFVELRADIKSAINKMYAEGYREFAEQLIAEDGEGKGIMHPKNSERLAIAQRILQSADNAHKQLCI
jgi:hypothetical protein